MTAATDKTTLCYRTNSETTEAHADQTVTVYIVPDGWVEIPSSDFIYQSMEIEDQPEEQADEPNSVERTVITARHHRRLATANRVRRVKNPRRIHYDDG